MLQFSAITVEQNTPRKKLNFLHFKKVEKNQNIIGKKIDRKNAVHILTYCFLITYIGRYGLSFISKLMQKLEICWKNKKRHVKISIYIFHLLLTFCAQNSHLNFDCHIRLTSTAFCQIASTSVDGIRVIITLALSIEYTQLCYI